MYHFEIYSGSYCSRATVRDFHEGENGTFSSREIQKAATAWSLQGGSIIFLMMKSLRINNTTELQGRGRNIEDSFLNEDPKDPNESRNYPRWVVQFLEDKIQYISIIYNWKGKKEKDS